MGIKKVIELFNKYVFLNLWICVTIWLVWTYASDPQNESNQCLMSWMYVDYDTVLTDEGSGYRMLRTTTVRGGKRRNVNSVPVFFLPGNSGSYQQSRSILQYSSLNSNPPWIDDYVQSLRDDFSGYSVHLDFYTFDFKEELSGLSSELLQNELLFLNKSIEHVLGLYGNENQKIIGIGHSMGGVVLNLLNHPNMRTVVALSSPIDNHPLMYDYEMHKLYQKAETTRRSVKKKSFVASFAGGFRDKLINFEQTLVDGNDGLSYVSYSIPGVRISADHQAMVWCNQFVQLISNCLLDLVNSPLNKDGAYSLSNKQQKKIFSSHFNSDAVSKFTSTSSKNLKKYLAPGINFTDSFENAKKGLLDVKDFSKNYKMSLKGIKSFSLYSMTNIKKNDFELYIEDSHGRLFRLNDAFEDLPYIMKRENHKEVTSYKKNIPKSLLYVDTLHEMNALYVKFTKRNANNNFFLELIKRKGRNKFHTVHTSYLRIGNPISHAQKNSVKRFKFPFLPVAIPYVFSVQKKRDPQCFIPASFYYYKNQERFGVGPMFSIKFYPSRDQKLDKGFELFLFNDPRCSHMRDSQVISLSFADVVIYLQKFRVAEIIIYSCVIPFLILFLWRKKYTSIASVMMENHFMIFLCFAAPCVWFDYVMVMVLVVLVSISLVYVFCLLIELFSSIFKRISLDWIPMRIIVIMSSIFVFLGMSWVTLLVLFCCFFLNISNALGKWETVFHKFYFLLYILNLLFFVPSVVVHENNLTHNICLVIWCVCFVGMRGKKKKKTEKENLEGYYWNNSVVWIVVGLAVLIIPVHFSELFAVNLILSAFNIFTICSIIVLKVIAHFAGHYQN